MTSEGGIMYGDEQYMNANMMPLSSLDGSYPPSGGMGGNLHS